MHALLAVGLAAIVIGWGVSRIQIVGGKALHNIQDLLQVLLVKGFIKIFWPEFS